MLYRSSVKHVVFKTAIFLLTLTVGQTKPIHHKRRVYCYPEKHEYYVQQMQGCKECDRCWSGEEPDLQGADLGMGLYGATKCPICRVCSEGTYNPDGDLHWDCLTCTTCSDLGLHEDEACTKTKDTKCSNNVQQVSERPVQLPPGPDNNVGQKNEGKDSPSEIQTGVSLAISVVGVVALITSVLYHQRRKLLQNRMGTSITPDMEESHPLNTCIIEIEPDEADDGLDSIKDMRNTENIPLIGSRKRHKSCGDYESTGHGFNKQVDKDKMDGFKRGIPAFQRQLSHPVTDREVKDNEQHLDKKRPNQKCVCFLSNLLAADEMYKAFAEKMGLLKYKIKRLEEERNQRHLNAEDIAYEYISRTLQSMPKVSYSDIYDTLTYLRLVDERRQLREIRHKFFG